MASNELKIPRYLLVAMIMAAPLIQGGTPRLPTLVLEIMISLVLILVLFTSRAKTLRLRAVSLIEASFAALVLIFALNLARPIYYHDAEHGFLLLIMYAVFFSVILRLPDGDQVALLSSVRWTGLFQAVLVLVQVSANSTGQPLGTFDNPNFLAGFLVFAGGLFAVRLPGMWADRGGRTTRPKTMAVFNTFAVALIIMAIIWTRSRGGMLSLAAVMVALLLLRFGLKALLPFGAALLGLFVFPNPFRERLMGIGLRDAYAFSRLDIWKSALLMFKDYPFLGVGPGQYRYFSPQYAFPVTTHWAHYAKVAENPHSEYLMLAAELGIPGLVCLILFIVGIVVIACRSLGADRRGSRLWPLALLWGCALQAAVDFNLHSPPMVLCSLAILGYWISGESRDEKSYGGRLMAARISGLIFIVLYTMLSLRAFFGFYLYIHAGGGPVDFFNERESLAEWGKDETKVDADMLRRAILMDGDCAPYHVALGSLALREYDSTGQESWLAISHQEINLAISLNPRNYRYYRHLTDLYLSLYRMDNSRKGMIEGAQKSMDQALLLAPSNVFLWEHLGRIKLEKGLLDEAARAFGKGVELEPCFLRARFEQVQVFEKLGLHDRVRQERDMILQWADECPGEAVAGDYERALIDFDMNLLHNLPKFPGGETP